MDFDDLDEAIDERIAEDGCLSGAAAMAGATMARKKLPRYEPFTYMPPIPRHYRVPAQSSLPEAVQKSLPEEADRKVCIRAILFYGNGDCVANWARMMATAPNYMEMACYEWPGHGTRDDEPCAKDFEELTNDACRAMKIALEDHGANKRIENAPFIFVGHGHGCQLMVQVAQKLRYDMSLEPQAIIALDRGAPNVPLFNDHGSHLCENDRRALMEAFQPQIYQESFVGGEDRLTMWMEDLKHANETRPVGFHDFECDIIVVKARGNAAMIGEENKELSSFVEARLLLEGSDDALMIPVMETSKLSDVKGALAKACLCDASDLSFLQKGGKQLGDSDKISGDIVVKGLKSFKPRKFNWPHQTGVIGAGYNGVKTAMTYLRQKQEDFVMFDRNDILGGYCWITAANKQSKIQTEYGSFHIWFGPEYSDELGWSDQWECHIKKPRVLEMMKKAGEDYGVLSHCKMQTNVEKIQIVGDPKAEDRYYKLTVKNLKGGDTFETNVSCMFNFPGSMTKNRIIDYPGEDTFGGQIGYGMNDDFDYEAMNGKIGAIIGNGAFAVENVRTCCQCHFKKVWLVTRHKNLPSPRVPCWFVHQGPQPTPGGQVIKMFEPMYALTGLGDPWSYKAVHANKARTKVTILQNSRFGIGDVTFLAHHYGKLEYIEDTIKRVTHHTLHMAGGRKVENCEGIIKSLGLLGDFGFDKLHSTKELVGTWINGDFRRQVGIDATGMNAANFDTFSLGSGVHGGTLSNKFLFDFPEEYYKIEAMGILQTLPKMYADDKLQKPAYCYDVKYAMSAGFNVGGICPRMNMYTQWDGGYKHCLYHTIHPTDKFLDYCIEDWDEYQKLFKDEGSKVEYIPYPYTREIVDGYFADFSRLTGVNISSDGPGADYAQKTLFPAVREMFKTADCVMTRVTLNETLFKGLPFDPDQLLQLSKVRKNRATVTAASGDCALDHDEEQHQEWSKWTTAKCIREEVESNLTNIMHDPAMHDIVWKIGDKYKAAKPK